MSQTPQRGGTTDYEPSEYADEFSEDPARILAKGKKSALARIRGVNDPELLQAYLDVEVSREARQEVIGAINQRKSKVKQCPRGCDEPVQRRFETSNGFQVKHQNAVWYKTCVIPQEDGSVVAVLHGEPDGDEESASHDAPPEDAQDAVEGDGTEEDSAGEAEPEEPTGETPRRIYMHLCQSPDALSLASLQGWAGTELNLSPDETERHVDALVTGGYAEEVGEEFWAER